MMMKSLRRSALATAAICDESAASGVRKSAGGSCIDRVAVKPHIAESARFEHVGRPISRDLVSGRKRPYGE